MPKQKTLSQISIKRENLKSRTFENSNKILVSNELCVSFETDINGRNSDTILQALSISIEGVEQKSLSLKQISNDKEFIKNPKIIERKDYKTLENEYDKPDDKFPNEDDPFYQLDDYREQNEVMNKKKENFTKSNKIAPITRSLLLSNRGGKKLKQFEVLK